LLPLLLLIWASFRIEPTGATELPVPANASEMMAQLAALPGSPAALSPPDFAMPVPGIADPRSQNAAIPFAVSKLDPAPPYRFSGSAADFGNARDCLALAAMAEAGSSDLGQRAVIQVILNRARHPAFANSVCGVVFEGSERSTGCQFSFTCDGSLARPLSERLWLAGAPIRSRELDCRQIPCRSGAEGLCLRDCRQRHPLPHRLGVPVVEPQAAKDRPD
jgi:hypothetical protein